MPTILIRQARCKGHTSQQPPQPQAPTDPPAPPPGPKNQVKSAKELYDRRKQVEGTLVNELANLEANKSLKRKRAFDEEVPEAGKKRKILPLKSKILAKATAVEMEAKAKETNLRKRA